MNAEKTKSCRSNQIISPKALFHSNLKQPTLKQKVGHRICTQTKAPSVLDRLRPNISVILRRHVQGLAAVSQVYTPAVWQWKGART